MLDSSAVSYREMALCNIAFAHVQLEENAEAQDYYRKTLAEFPESIMAKSSLAHLESLQHSDRARKLLPKNL
ncbi:MAG: hypothetical protein WKF92_07835 [Pyrinomonadaceae bacterium]